MQILTRHDEVSRGINILQVHYYYRYRHRCVDILDNHNNVRFTIILAREYDFPRIRISTKLNCLICLQTSVSFWHDHIIIIIVILPVTCA
jgi:hypothetical protein